VVENMINNKIFLTSVTIFTILTIFAITPSIMSVFGVSGNTTIFNVSVTVITGNPTITIVDAISDIPATGASIIINQSGTSIASTGCIVNSTSGITNRYDCNITLQYYHLPGTWTINATIVDTGSNRATNTSIMYTNGNTYGVAVTVNNVTFSGSPGQTVQPSTQQVVNNTGNIAYTSINLTAFEIRSGSNIIDARNFTANTTGTGSPGHTLINNTAVTLGNSSVDVQTTRDLNISLTIPTGTTNGTYTSVSSWIITLI
jgi:hypothetical protein